jgi:hypothetical protein
LVLRPADALRYLQIVIFHIVGAGKTRRELE